LWQKTQHGMHLRRQLGQKTREMRLHRRRQLVQVIDHEHEAATIAAEVRENPIHHRASVEARRGGTRLIRVALPCRISDGSSKASQNNCSSFWSRRTETNATLCV
jgi:hypothetical protein